MPFEANEEVILVVDDSSDTVSMLNDALEESGFSILVALSGMQAISICKKITPDLILLDAMMPELDGFETCRRIRQNPQMQNVPVIFMTGLDSTDVVSSSFESGANDYIQKPIRLPELKARIESHIKKAKQLNAAKDLLDSNGISTFAINLNGSFLWSTPNATKVLEHSGFNKISLVNELPMFFKAWLKKAQVGDDVVIQNSKPKLKVKLENEKDDTFIFTILKDAVKVNENEILAKAFSLTDRESEVLYWVTQGKSNKDLALILGISPRTVNKHLESVFEKMYVENRTSAANMALKELSKY